MSIIKRTTLGAASLLAAAVIAGPSFADGLPDRGRIAAPHGCSVSGSVGLTSDYVFRGITQSSGNAAVQGTVELSCGKFYVGSFASSIDFGVEGTVEVDIYGGYKFTTGKINWDAGFIYYTYPGQNTNLDADFVELKLSASGEIVKGGTLTGTIFYSPEYTGSTGAVATYEVSYAYVLPKFSIFSPTVSATYGYSDFMDESFRSYAYWNVGVTLAFREKWSVDLRYWDTDDNNGFCLGLACDERFVATLKYSF